MATRTFIDVAGLICADLFPQSPPEITATNLASLVEPGSLHLFGPMDFATGGAVPNTGLGLDQLGFPARLIGKVGDDWLGQVTLGKIQDSARGNPDITRFIRTDNDPKTGSAYSVVGCVPGIDRWFHHCPGPNETFGANDVPFADMAETLILHFGYPPLMKRMWQNNGDELESMFRQARRQGIITSLDMANPHPSSEAFRADWHRIYIQVLPYVSIFLPSFDELLATLLPVIELETVRQLMGQGIAPILSHLSQILILLGTPIVVIKYGENGLYLRTSPKQEQLATLGWNQVLDVQSWADVELLVPCLQVTPVGTTGAGDTTIAGFLAGQSRGLDPAAVMRMAAGTGACCVEQMDAISGIRLWEEINQRIKAGWPLHPLPEIGLGPGWEWDSDIQAWRGPCHKH